ncbi:MAG: hypothetical protein WAO02_00085 [Verrucomicrobiia bacterium]
MTNKQQTHLKMFIATLLVVDKFKQLWSAIVAFVNARDAFAEAIDNIRAQEMKQSTATTGVTANKRKSRDAMCRAAAMVGGALAAYADTQQDHELFVLADYSVSDLTYMPEEACLNKCSAILNAGTDNLAALKATKHLVQADLDDLQTKIDDFKTALERPRQTKAETKSATDQLPASIDATDGIVERQLDKLMERFRDTNPDFYSEYQLARQIIDLSGNGGNTPAPTPAPATTTTATTPAAATPAPVTASATATPQAAPAAAPAPAVAVK